MYDELYARIEQMFATVTPSYAGHQGDVLVLIQDCRQAIKQQVGKLGPWETKELATVRVTHSFRQGGVLWSFSFLLEKFRTEC